MTGKILVWCGCIPSDPGAIVAGDSAGKDFYPWKYPELHKKWVMHAVVRLYRIINSKAS
jgi:hypothetical protein